MFKWPNKQTLIKRKSGNDYSPTDVIMIIDHLIEACVLKVKLMSADETD